MPVALTLETVERQVLVPPLQGRPRRRVEMLDRQRGSVHSARSDERRQRDRGQIPTFSEDSHCLLSEAVDLDPCLVEHAHGFGVGLVDNGYEEVFGAGRFASLDSEVASRPVCLPTDVSVTPAARVGCRSSGEEPRSPPVPGRHRSARRVQRELPEGIRGDTPRRCRPRSSSPASTPDRAASASAFEVGSPHQDGTRSGGSFRGRITSRSPDPELCRIRSQRSIVVSCPVL